MIHALDIRISREELDAMTPEEKEKFVNNIYSSMTVEQQVQMMLIGIRVVKDDVLQRAAGRSRTALRTMARAVNVTVNEAKETGETSKHPLWCRLMYDDCWSVLSGYVTDEEYCTTCEFYKYNNPVNVLFTSEEKP